MTPKNWTLEGKIQKAQQQQTEGLSMYLHQRYTYRVLQPIQMLLIMLYVTAEPPVSGSTETALKFKCEIQIG